MQHSDKRKLEEEGEPHSQIPQIFDNQPEQQEHVIQPQKRNSSG